MAWLLHIKIHRHCWHDPCNTAFWHDCCKKTLGIVFAINSVGMNLATWFQLLMVGLVRDLVAKKHRDWVVGVVLRLGWDGWGYKTALLHIFSHSTIYISCYIPLHFHPISPIRHYIRLTLQFHSLQEKRRGNFKLFLYWSVVILIIE